MHAQRPLNRTCAVAVYLLDPTKIRVVYDKSMVDKAIQLDIVRVCVRTQKRTVHLRSTFHYHLSGRILQAFVLLQLRFLMRLQKPSLQILLLFRLGKFSFTRLSVGATKLPMPVLTGNLIHL